MIISSYHDILMRFPRKASVALSFSIENCPVLIAPSFKRAFDLIYFYFIFFFDNPKDPSDIAPRMENTTTPQANGQGQCALHDHENLLADLSAFVADILDHPTMENGRKLSLIAGTVLHDIGGTLNREHCFLPRVNGYASRSYRQSFPASA